MKKLFILLAMVVFFGGCSGVKVNLQDFVVDLGVEYIAYEIGIDNPDDIDRALDVCDQIMDGTIDEVVLQAGVNYLMENYTSHPVIGSRLSKLSSYIEIDSGLDLDRVKELVPAFRQGLITARM